MQYDGSSSFFTFMMLVYFQLQFSFEWISAITHRVGFLEKCNIYIVAAGAAAAVSNIRRAHARWAYEYLDSMRCDDGDDDDDEAK